MRSRNVFTGQDYEIGFCKPPKETRFKKGTSGNPAGRPKGAKNKDKTMRTRLHDVIVNEAYRQVEVSDKNGPSTMTVAEAVTRSVSVQAAKGCIGAQRLFLESLNSVEAMRVREKHDYFKAAVKYKQDWTAAIKRAERGDGPMPDMLPHPNDIRLDFTNVAVTIHGPMNDEEKAEWDRLFSVVERCEEELSELAPMRAKAKHDGVVLPTAEVVEFLLLRSGLEIMRRWRISAERIVKDTMLRAKLELHFLEGTNPPPLTS